MAAPPAQTPNGTANGVTNPSSGTNAQAGPSSPTNRGDVQMNGTNGTSEPKAPSGPDTSQLFAARREEELARRDRSLADLLLMLDGYKPLVGLSGVCQWPGSYDHCRFPKKSPSITFNERDSTALILDCGLSRLDHCSS